MSLALTDAYLERVGLAHPGPPCLTALEALHAAHVAAIPFENLDILLGRGIRLDLPDLRRKLIDERRGGYCFEQNGLFLAVLRELGFRAAPLEARVRAGATTLLPRTHMIIAVELEGARWLADVGFGAEGPSGPVPFSGEPTPAVAGLSFRIAAEGDSFALQMREEAGWTDQYAFRTDPVHAVDYEVASWYTSTHPTSAFVRRLTVQRATREIRHVLRYPIYSAIRAGGRDTREIRRAELLPLLRDVFHIDLPPDTVFPAIDGATAPAPA